MPAIYGHRLPPRTGPLPQVSHPAGRSGSDGASAAWGEVLPVSDAPTCGPASPPGWLERGAVGVSSFSGARADHPGRRRAGPLLPTPLSASCWWPPGAAIGSLTGQHDVAFGTTVSGRPAELPGADSMVGLLINTVLVRGHWSQRQPPPPTYVDQLHNAHNHTLDHEHLALNDIHRVTGHDHLFDTLFVYENYPLDTATLSSIHGLAVTEFSQPRIERLHRWWCRPYPGRELEPPRRVSTPTYSTRPASKMPWSSALKRAQAAMTADLSLDDCHQWMHWTRAEHARSGQVGQPG